MLTNYFSNTCLDEFPASSFLPSKILYMFLDPQSNLHVQLTVTFSIPTTITILFLLAKRMCKETGS
jgi:hypothetical protein